MRRLATFALLASLGLAAERRPPSPAAKPFVKLFAVYGPGKLEGFSDEQIKRVARNFGWINGHGGGWLRTAWPDGWQYFAGPSGGVDAQGRTIAERLRAENPEIIITNYRNGSYTSQNALPEAAEQERTLPLSIAVLDTGARLTRPVASADRTIELQPPPGVPPGQPAIYPFKASTTDALFTQDKAKYVAWLRLEDEILRIDRAERREDRIVLTVKRGAFNTSPAAHGAETVVLAPVYCGSARKDGREYYLSGLPDGNSPQRALRYVLMQQRPEYWNHLASIVAEVFKEGYDGPWLDTVVSSWINHSNAYGVRIEAPYDVDLKRPLDRETYREYQQRKIDALFQKFPNGRFYVNWYFPRYYFDNGHEKWMFSGEKGHRPISGGAIEMYANELFMEWKDLMRMQLDMRDNRYRVVAYIKRADTGNDLEMPEEYRLFCYGTHLLVYEQDIPQYWGTAWKPAGPDRMFTPPAFVYWDLGKPLEKFERIEQAERKDSPGVYQRRYQNGLVVVNPDLKITTTVRLDAEYFEPQSAAWVSSVALMPRTARLLLREGGAVSGSPAPANKPYIRMYTQVWTADARRINNLPEAEREAAISDLTRWYAHFTTGHSNEFTLGDPTRDPAGVTLAERLAKRGAMVSMYRNGSYVSQAVKGDINSREAMDLETRAPLAISTWWPGHKNPAEGSLDDPSARLAEPLDDQARRVVVTGTEKARPAKAPDIWPYMPSRGAGAEPDAKVSASSHDVISWVRIGDEILRVREAVASGGNIVLTVDRGYFGTAPRAHAKGGRVFSPVYIGSSAVIGWDRGLSGSPPVDRPDRPLRYGIKIWQGPSMGTHKDGISWLAGRIRETFGVGLPAPYFQGYNTVWLDITSCAAYNNSDAYGSPVTPWDDPRDALMTADQLGAYQAAKVAEFKKQIGPATGYPALGWLANNLVAGAGIDACRNRLISSSGLDGGVLEFWLQNPKVWEAQMAQHFLIMVNNWPAIYWAKWDQLASHLKLAQYKRFTYGAYLMAYRPTATRPQYGGPFSLKKPDDIYFWDWGKPRGAPSSLADLAKVQCGAASVYRREYENGVILWNPGEVAANCTLDREYWDVGAEPRRVNEAAVGPRDAAFLLRIESR